MPPAQQRTIPAPDIPATIRQSHPLSSNNLQAFVIFFNGLETTSCRWPNTKRFNKEASFFGPVWTRQYTGPDASCLRRSPSTRTLIQYRYKYFIMPKRSNPSTSIPEAHGPEVNASSAGAALPKKWKMNSKKNHHDAVPENFNQAPEPDAGPPSGSPPAKKRKVKGPSGQVQPMPEPIYISVAKRPENEWIVDLYIKWTTMLVKMDQIFNKKGGPTVKDCPQQPSREWRIDRMGMVLADLFAAEEPDLFVPFDFTGRGTAHATPGDIVANIFRVASGDDLPWEKGRVLGALRIPSSSKDGLRKCELTYHPYQGDPTFTLRRRSSWSSALLPPGAVQRPHVQFATASQFIRHIEGLMLWFFWPWTEHNIEIFKHFGAYEHRGEMKLEDAIEKFEGLELRWNEPGDCFYIPPFHFTACMVFTPSSYAGLQLWGLSEFPKARSITETMLDIHRSSSSGRIDNMDMRSQFITQMLFYDLECWESLVETCEDPRLHAEINEWILETRPALEAAIGGHDLTARLYDLMQHREGEMQRKEAVVVARDAADPAPSEEPSVKDDKDTAAEEEEDMEHIKKEDAEDIKENIKEEDMEHIKEEDAEDIKDEDTEDIKGDIKEEDTKRIKEEDIEYIKEEDSASEVIDIMALTDDSDGGC
ncbi:hypothetical protein M422DRAFT_263870 [Sphaerobolus stellatus SS14]|uniref:JmjC domain-containing protein n=1 Tax=Sphaerobolus stellatus (strain SS14) TaxID=990650 RepID=A0A0C9V9U5_SPHS4|nr:hypothetical protein M422DRAFT_263870 [Sphaerobolus stellatus SS14]